MDCSANLGRMIVGVYEGLCAVNICKSYTTFPFILPWKSHLYAFTRKLKGDKGMLDSVPWWIRMTSFYRFGIFCIVVLGFDRVLILVMCSYAACRGKTKFRIALILQIHHHYCRLLLITGSTCVTLQICPHNPAQMSSFSFHHPDLDMLLKSKISKYDILNDVLKYTTSAIHESFSNKVIFSKIFVTCIKEKSFTVFWKWNLISALNIFSDIFFCFHHWNAMRPSV